jgi:hypothetical protein
VFTNNNRYDLSQNLIHFFRSIDEESDNCPRLPELFEWDSDEVRERPLSPFFLLRNALRYGKLWAGWSHRKGEHTIYGNDSAVCFTDMPIPAFIEAGTARSQKAEAMSPYGLVFIKSKLQRMGARPAIYGLEEPPRISHDDHGRRFIDTDQLPLLEQYRFVSHFQTEEKTSDWTHEREWRWPLRDGQLYESGETLQMDDFEGLDLDDPMLSGIGIIVKSTKQANKIERDILMKYDRGDIPQNHFSFIMALDEIESLSSLKDPRKLDQILAASKVDISSYLKVADDVRTEILNTADRFVQEIDSATPLSSQRERGGCWLWLTDNTHIVTRAFLTTRHVRITKNGKYLVNIQKFSTTRDLREREVMTQKFAEKLTQKYGVTCGFFSVENSFNPNNVPFHRGACDTSNYTNFSYHKEDY